MPDEPSTGNSEIAALAQRVATARGKLPLQHDTALVEVLSDAEIAAERELAEWIRAQRRGQRRRAIEDELAAEKLDRRTTAALRRAEEADARWHRRALAARRRVANQDARLAQLYRRAEWSSRALIGIVILGMVWAGVNVQHNLVPSGDMSDPLYWLSYGIEAMISIPIITIMVVATTAARWGRELPRGKVIVFEAALLGTTVALNTGPHLAAGDLGRAAEYAIAPAMVGVVIWLHAWVAARYAQLIDSVPIVDDTAVPKLRGAYGSAERQWDTAGLVVDSAGGPSAIATSGADTTAGFRAGYVEPQPLENTRGGPTSVPAADAEKQPLDGPYAEAVSAATNSPASTDTPVTSNSRASSSTPPTTNSHASTSSPTTSNSPASKNTPPSTETPAFMDAPTAADTPASEDEEPGPDATTDEASMAGLSYLVPLSLLTGGLAEEDDAPRTPRRNGSSNGRSAHTANDAAAQPVHFAQTRLRPVNGNGRTAPTMWAGSHALQTISYPSSDAAEGTEPVNTTDAVDLAEFQAVRGGKPTPAPDEHAVTDEATPILDPNDSEQPEPARARTTRRHNASGAKSGADDTAPRERAEATAEQLTLEPEPEPQRPRSTEIILATQRAIAEEDADDELDQEPDSAEDEVRLVARNIAEQGLSKLPVEQIADILTLADQSWSSAGIAKEVGVSGSAVARVIDSAHKVRRPYAASN
ncbi:hypothetical protein [Nocardia sp. NPDC050793]|uniref:hypothetical protein n=1 Tax=Nocardia sp. NPDC050793 TaxID=3155159 RepID=UPI0033EB52DA